MSRFRPGDLCSCDITLTTREGSYGERIPGYWGVAKTIELPPCSPMIIMFICDDPEFVKSALVLTRFGYV